MCVLSPCFPFPDFVVFLFLCSGFSSVNVDCGALTHTINPEDDLWIKLNKDDAEFRFYKEMMHASDTVSSGKVPLLEMLLDL